MEFTRGFNQIESNIEGFQEAHLEVAIVDHAFQLELFRLVKFWLIISMIFISIFSQINFLNTILISIDLFF